MDSPSDHELPELQAGVRPGTVFTPAEAGGCKLKDLLVVDDAVFARPQSSVPSIKGLNWSLLSSMLLSRCANMSLDRGQGLARCQNQLAAWMTEPENE